MEDVGRGYGRNDKVAFARQMCDRTKAASIEIINLMDRLPSSPALNNVRFQLIKSATSVAANYRAACRARSRKEFYAKLSITIEETDETIFWLEILRDSNIKVDAKTIDALLPEWETFLRIFAKARKSMSST